MTYEELLQKLFRVNLFGGMKLGLQNMLRLDAQLQHPHRNYRTIHVAGTNGKGSVTKKIATALTAAGYKVGLYCSPHISTFRERISIDGQLISKDEIVATLPHLFAVAEQERITPTFFEFTTMLALEYFAKQKADFAVLEVGLGGRLDATNIITPILSVITSISLEHTEILGNTLEQITAEKGGIIKTNIPVVIGPTVPLEPIKAIAASLCSPLTIVTGMFSSFEEENRAIAAQALKLLHLPPQAVEQGLNAKMPCRFEVVDLSKMPTRMRPQAIILDVAHNPDGLKRLFQEVRNRYPKAPLRILFGLSATKDLDGCLKLLKEHGTAWHPVEAPNGRGAQAMLLKKKLMELGVAESQIHLAPIKESIVQALTLTHVNNELLIVCGTFFIMGVIRAQLGFDDPQDHIDMNEQLRSIT